MSNYWKWRLLTNARACSGVRVDDAPRSSASRLEESLRRRRSIDGRCGGVFFTCANRARSAKSPFRTFRTTGGGIATRDHRVRHHSGGRTTAANGRSQSLEKKRGVVTFRLSVTSNSRWTAGTTYFFCDFCPACLGFRSSYYNDGIQRGTFG